MKNILKGGFSMKRILVVLSLVAVLGIGTAAFAHGGFGWGGHMGSGWGMGPGMMGYGPGYGYTEETQKYFEETADLRRDLHTKRFEYYEALRAGDTKKAEKIAREIEELTEKLYANAPRGRNFAKGGYGCW
jgi:hypothetical protein